MSDIEICKCQGRYWQLHCTFCGLPFEPAVAERDDLKAKCEQYAEHITTLRARVQELESVVRLSIERHARIKELEAKLARYEEALRQSCKLQAHYAELLNMHDGGERMIFKSMEEWLERLEQCSQRARQAQEQPYE